MVDVFLVDIQAGSGSQKMLDLVRRLSQFQDAIAGRFVSDVNPEWWLKDNTKR
jgi:hypothetical protein